MGRWQTIGYLEPMELRERMLRDDGTVDPDFVARYLQESNERLGALFDAHPQDVLDGAALRRLREALPMRGKGAPARLALRGPWNPHGDNGLPVWQVVAEHYNGPDLAEGLGDTIAEAADECREALG